MRNLERRKDTSFWLQTASDRFYPDFLALLEDGRILTLEYKGEHLYKINQEERKAGFWLESALGCNLKKSP
jgi:type III restriction enzyme